MRSKSSLFIVCATLISFALSALILPRFAGAQDEIKREIKLRNKTAKVGVINDEASKGEDPTLWAVLIGVSQYKYTTDATDDTGIKNLRFADDDARAVYDFLRSPEGGGFQDKSEGGHMVLLTDEDATKANVESALLELKQSKPNDYFVIFIAAHGAMLQYKDRKTNSTAEEAFFAVHDTDIDNPDSTAIRMESFRQLVKEIPARKGVVFSDTCYSAGVQLGGRSVGATVRANASYINKMKDTPEGVGFLWSAGINESAGEPVRLGHGYFTYCLLEALRNGDIDRNEKVTFQEVASFVIREVETLTEGKQHPYYSEEKGEAKGLPLAVVPYAGSEGDLSTEGTLVIRTPDLDGVQVAIDGEYLPDKFSANMERTIRVKAGTRNVSFIRGGKKTDLPIDVKPRKSNLVEVNLTFSQSSNAEDSLLDPPVGVLNAFLTEDKEPSKEAKELFDKGFDSFKKQKFDEAISLFTKAINANAGAYAQAYVFLGRAQQTLGREEAAIVSYTNALKLKPTDYETETLLAEVKLNSGKYNVADIAKELERIKNRHPHYEYARIVYADVLITRNNFWAAERELKQAIRIQPKSPPAHMILAQALNYQRSKAKQKQAVEEAQKAIDLFNELAKKKTSFKTGLKRLSISHVIFGGGKYLDYPGMIDAHRTLADTCVIYTEIDDTLPNPGLYLDRAQASIQEAIKLATQSNDKVRLAYTREMNAQVYNAKQETGTAIKEAQQALSLSDTDDLKAQAHFTLYRAYKSEQKFNKAAESLGIYLALDGSQLSPKERESWRAELDRLNQAKNLNKQK
jgi:tetratricopeptide (TPR) repeat protein/uncharacterized caspase-like protein